MGAAKQLNEMSMEVDDVKRSESISCSVSLSVSPSGSRRLKEKRSIAPFKMDAVKGGAFTSLTEADLNDRWSVLYFYPFDLEPVSTANLKSLNAKSSEFAALSAQLIGVSTESHYAHLAFIQNGLG